MSDWVGRYFPGSARSELREPATMSRALPRSRSAARLPERLDASSTSSVDRHRRRRVRDLRLDGEARVLLDDGAIAQGHLVAEGSCGARASAGSKVALQDARSRAPPRATAPASRPRARARDHHEVQAGEVSLRAVSRGVPHAATHLGPSRERNRAVASSIGVVCLELRVVRVCRRRDGEGEMREFGAGSAPRVLRRGRALPRVG